LFEGNERFSFAVYCNSAWLRPIPTLPTFIWN